MVEQATLIPVSEITSLGTGITSEVSAPISFTNVFQNLAPLPLDAPGFFTHDTILPDFHFGPFSQTRDLNLLLDKPTFLDSMKDPLRVDNLSVFEKAFLNEPQSILDPDNFNVIQSAMDDLQDELDLKNIPETTQVNPSETVVNPKPEMPDIELDFPDFSPKIENLMEILQFEPEKNDVPLRKVGQIFTPQTERDRKLDTAKTLTPPKPEKIQLDQIPSDEENAKGVSQNLIIEQQQPSARFVIAEKAEKVRREKLHRAVDDASQTGQTSGKAVIEKLDSFDERANSPIRPKDDPTLPYTLFQIREKQIMGKNKMHCEVDQAIKDHEPVMLSQNGTLARDYQVDEVLGKVDIKPNFKLKYFLS